MGDPLAPLASRSLANVTTAIQANSRETDHLVSGPHIMSKNYLTDTGSRENHCGWISPLTSNKYHEEFTKLRTVARNEDLQNIIARFSRKILPQLKMLEGNAGKYIYVTFTYDRL